MDNQTVSETDQKGERGRRPYDRPAIHWEEDFEPYEYGGCGKMPAQSPSCNAMSSS